MKLFGNFTALVTPMKNQRQIDFEALDELLEIQIQEQTDGIVLFGSTGEGHMLSTNEKIKIFKFCKEKIQNKFPIVVSVLSYSTIDCKKEISRFSKLQADAFLISSPPYIKPTQKGLLKHFLALANFSPKPIIVYDIPSRTGTSISFETMQKLSLHQNIIGVKEASTCFSDIVKMSSLISDNFKILCGNDNFILPMLSLGASGVVSVIGNAFPKTVHTLFEMFEFDPKMVGSLYEKFSRFVDVLSIETNPIPIKFLLSLFTKTKTIYRSPLYEPSKEHKKEILSAFENFKKETQTKNLENTSFFEQ